MKAPFVIAALLSGVLLAPQASAEPPAVFVHQLYMQYKDMDHWSKNFDPCNQYCEADFVKLVKKARDKKLIDYDPICQCRKGGEQYMMFSGTTGASDSEYRVKMKKLGQPKGGWTLILHWSDGGWKLHDVLEPRGGKLVSLRQRVASAGS